MNQNNPQNFQLENSEYFASLSPADRIAILESGVEIQGEEDLKYYVEMLNRYS